MGDWRQQLAEIRDRLFPRRMCAKKNRYLSEEYARRVLHRRQALSDEALYLYECPECGGWHLTRMEQSA